MQQYARAVFVPWDGGTDLASFAKMQQGIVVNLDFGEDTDGVPAGGTRRRSTSLKWYPVSVLALCKAVQIFELLAVSNVAARFFD